MNKNINNNRVNKITIMFPSCRVQKSSDSQSVSDYLDKINISSKNDFENVLHCFFKHCIGSHTYYGTVILSF